MLVLTGDAGWLGCISREWLRFQGSTLSGPWESGVLHVPGGQSGTILCFHGPSVGMLSPCLLLSSLDARLGFGSKCCQLMGGQAGTESRKGIPHRPGCTCCSAPGLKVTAELPLMS